MFQGLTQGAIVSILYRNEARVVDGRVTSVSTHPQQFNPQQPMAFMNGPVTDITVQVGNDTIPFKGLPANGVSADFADKGIYLATDPSSIRREVGAFKSALYQDLQSVPAKQKLYDAYEALDLELNPERKKEQAQAQEITQMRSELAEMKQLLLALQGHNQGGN